MAKHDYDKPGTILTFVSAAGIYLWLFINIINPMHKLDLGNKTKRYIIYIIYRTSIHPFILSIPSRKTYGDQTKSVIYYESLGFFFRTNWGVYVMNIALILQYMYKFVLVISDNRDDKCFTHLKLNISMKNFLSWQCKQTPCYNSISYSLYIRYFYWLYPIRCSIID